MENNKLTYTSTVSDIAVVANENAWYLNGKYHHDNDINAQCESKTDWEAVAKSAK